jgi:hypothetical protein
MDSKTWLLPYSLYVWTAFTAMILNLAAEDTVCPPACPSACPFTLWLSTWPFFGCLGAVYVKDVLPSCDDIPAPNNDASLELQHFEKNHVVSNMRRFASQIMTHWKASTSHLEPGVKSSSSSPRNILITLQPAYRPHKPHPTSTLPQLVSTPEYAHISQLIANWLHQLEWFAITTLDILTHNRLCADRWQKLKRKVEKGRFCLLRWCKALKRKDLASEVRETCKEKQERTLRCNAAIYPIAWGKLPTSQIWVYCSL